MTRINRLISRFYEIRNRLGFLFWSFQKFLFAFFIIGGIGQFAYNIAIGYPIGEELSKFVKVGYWWIMIAGSIALLWIVSRRAFDFDLWLYYNLWIDKLAPILYSNRSIEYQRILDIKSSFEFQKNRKRPTFIRREHLGRRRYWPNWVFSIITIFNPRKVKQRIVIDENHKMWVLDLDLRDESFGLYNNAGKRFLTRRFGKSATSDEIIKQSSRFHNFMLPSAPAGNSMIWGETGENVPLRWASGGFLPIVRYNKRHWALLFFRDIPPIGLNVANGASENKNEYKDLHRLIGREFSEEVILLSAMPRPEGDIHRRVFSTFCFDPDLESPIAKYLNTKFSKKQADLRYRHDGIHLITLTDRTRNIKPIDTPFSVRVSFHLPDIRKSSTNEIQNVIYSVNPAEFGIEVIWLCSFNLFEDEYLIDGEYHLSREVLIRRPIILLDMDYLERVFKQDKAFKLGKMVRTDNVFECKLLNPVPRQHCEIFDVDIALRHNRLRKISQELLDQHISQEARENLEWEASLIQSWLSKYEKAFSEAREKGLQSELLRTLCPVTWKALELIMAHRIKYRA